MLEYEMQFYLKGDCWRMNLKRIADMGDKSGWKYVRRLIRVGSPAPGTQSLIKKRPDTAQL